uniref:Uncharacterized protein n=1 Tax=Oryza punctata TaxID=4537 RepID=A0A0E0MIX9_ORYPU
MYSSTMPFFCFLLCSEQPVGDDIHSPSVLPLLCSVHLRAAEELPTKLDKIEKNLYLSRKRRHKGIQARWILSQRQGGAALRKPHAQNPQSNLTFL